MSTLCKSYQTADGLCTSCYPGYILLTGSCVIAPQVVNNCQKYASGICISCYSGYFLKLSVCSPLNPLCKTYNLTNGNCLSCYPGYTLTVGLCSIAISDPNCLSLSGNGGCLKCSKGFFLNTTGKCQQMNPLCKNSDSNGLCLDCYPGYTFTSGTCIIGVTQVAQNCMTVQSGVCIKCFSRYYLTTLGVC